MHARVQRESEARRKAHGKNMDLEDAEREEVSEGEVDNFQELQLGSITPLVHCKDNLLRPSIS